MKEMNKPAAWANTKLKYISNVIYGKGLPASKRNAGNFPVVSSAGIVGSHTESTIPGPIVVTGRKGTLGKPHFIESDSWVIDTAYGIKPHNGLKTKFLYWLIDSLQLADLQSSTAIPSLSREALYNVDVPIPPLKEQHRIVQKIETCFEKIDSTEQNLTKVETLLEKYRESLLAKAFRGELVPQNPNDEPASVLLEKIRAEREQNQKGKKKKQEFAPISDDEKPFDIPDSWEWVRLGELGSFINGHAFKSKDFTDSSGIQLVRMGNVTPRGLNLEKAAVYLPMDFLKTSSNYALEENDLLLSLTGTIGKEDFGNVVRLEGEVNLLLNQRVLAIRSNLLHGYLYWLFQTVYFREKFFKLGKGQRQSNVSPVALSKLVVPLPPSSIISSIHKSLNRVKDLLDRSNQSIRLAKSLSLKQRESVLSKAFEGQLVEQIPSEGTGHELLEKILAAKETEKPKKTAGKRKKKSED